jgi:hypothetical protein
MSYTETTDLLLKKAVIGSNQPFETAEMNSNWDKIDVKTATKGDNTTASTVVRIDGGDA